MAAGVVATLAAAAIVWFRSDAAVIDRVTRWWAAAWLRAAGARLSVQGLENVEPGRSYVVVSNHESNLDSMAYLQALPLSLRFLAKREMFRAPVLGWVMRATGMVEVDRSAPDLYQIDDAAARCLRAGQSLLVYPEGTTSADGMIGGFKDGAFVLAIRNQVPILPVTIHGTGRVWPAGRAVIHSGEVHILIGRPVPVTGLTHRDARHLRDQVRHSLLAAHHDLAASGAQ